LADQPGGEPVPTREIDLVRQHGLSLTTRFAEDRKDLETKRGEPGEKGSFGLLKKTVKTVP